MSKIEWTHRPGTKSEVLNPTTGCDKVSPGCRSCYAEVMHKRLRGMGQPKYQQPFLGHVKYWPDELQKPFRWKKPRTVFLNSMSDIFHKDIDVQQIAEIYAMMFLTPNHTYIVLTKRADRAYYVLTSVEFFEAYHAACNRLHDKYIQTLEQEMYQLIELESMWPLKNVWQGVSAENQETYDARVKHLMITPGYIKVISVEPQLGPINMLSRFESNEYNNFWILNGGESGSKARPSHPDWFRTIRDQCKYAGIPYFFKQFGNWYTDSISMTTGLPVFRMYNSYEHFTQKDWVKKGQKCIDLNGKICSIGKDFQQAAYPVAIMTRVKKKDNNFLDGVQHLEFPA